MKMEKIDKWLIIGIGILLVLALMKYGGFWFFGMFPGYGEPTWIRLPMEFKKLDNNTYVSNVFSDWIRNAVWYTIKVDGKECGGYSGQVNCSNILKDFNKCEITADYRLGEFDFVTIGRYTIEGKVLRATPNYYVGCAASMQDWINQITPRGTYRKATWYGWVEVNFDARTLQYSNEPGKVYTCEQKGLGVDCKGLLKPTLDNVINSQVKFYRTIVTPVPKTCEDYGYYTTEQPCPAGTKPVTIKVDSLICYTGKCEAIAPTPPPVAPTPAPTPTPPVIAPKPVPTETYLAIGIIVAIGVLIVVIFILKKRGRI
jgi:hypothetical protein